MLIDSGKEPGPSGDGEAACAVPELASVAAPRDAVVPFAGESVCGGAAAGEEAGEEAGDEEAAMAASNQLLLIS